MRRYLVFAWVLTVLLSSHGRADDWPQWLGPHRDSVWRETGILQRFPAKGLEIKWRANVELGYSGPAVAKDKVYVMDYVRKDGQVTNNPGGRDQLDGSERVLCFSAGSGQLLWKHEYPCSYSVSYGSGPRCTPTVDVGKVYALGTEGDLLCLDADNGSVIWSKNLNKEYKTETPIWGYSAHPLVDDDLLYCVVGGPGSVAVAFDKRTGREVWRALAASDPGYCPPALIDHGGTRQLLIWHPKALNSLNPRTGDAYWSVPLEPSYGMSITAPRKSGDLLYTSGIGTSAVLLKLDKNKPAAEELWRGVATTAVYCAGSTPIIDQGMIYGSDCQLGALIGVRMKDGKRLWSTFEPTSGGDRRASHGTAFLVKHQDRYFLFSETGDLIVAKLSPKGYDEISRFHVLDPTNECFGRDVVWSHPAFANRSVFVRNDKELVCVSLADTGK